MKDHKQHLNETIVKVNSDLINALQEIEQLKKENEGLHKEKAFYSEQWENVCKENEELIKFNKNVKGVLESIGKPHLGLALSSMLDKANELLTKKG